MLCITDDWGADRRAVRAARREGISYVRLDGSTSARRRQEALRAFASPDLGAAPSGFSACLMFAPAEEPIRLCNAVLHTKLPAVSSKRTGWPAVLCRSPDAAVTKYAALLAGSPTVFLASLKCAAAP